MGDMGDVFNGLRDERKKQKQDNFAANVARLSELPISLLEKSAASFKGVICGKTVMYYPSTNKWQFKNKIYRGSFEQFRSWLIQQLQKI